MAKLLIFSFLFLNLGTFSLHAHLEDPALRQRILKTVKENLSVKNKVYAHVITSTIMHEAYKYRLDPYIIAAVIKGESNFNPRAVGSMGEIGLMQLKESTAKWITKKMKISWRGKRSLYDPLTNIKIGSAYLGYLNEKLESHGGHLYLDAYNRGYWSVAKSLAKNIQPAIYSKNIMKKYLSLNSANESSKI